MFCTSEKIESPLQFWLEKSWDQSTALPNLAKLALDNEVVHSDLTTLLRLERVN